MFEHLLIDGKLQVRYWDDPILSTVCTPVEENEFGPELERFGQLLLDLMTAKNGAGMAGNQAGFDRRVFVMGYPEDSAVQPLVVCNPEITPLGKPVPHEEGCLSVPGIYNQVLRPENCLMTFRRPTGERAEVRFDKFPLAARVAQHETDHLDGIMFFDRRRMAKNLSKNVLRQWDKVRHQYGN